MTCCSTRTIKRLDSFNLWFVIDLFDVFSNIYRNFHSYWTMPIIKHIYFCDTSLLCYVIRIQYIIWPKFCNYYRIIFSIYWCMNSTVVCFISSLNKLLITSHIDEKKRIFLTLAHIFCIHVSSCMIWSSSCLCHGIRTLEYFVVYDYKYKFMCTVTHAVIPRYLTSRPPLPTSTNG